MKVIYLLQRLLRDQIIQNITAYTNRMKAEWAKEDLNNSAVIAKSPYRYKVREILFDGNGLEELRSITREYKSL